MFICMRYIINSRDKRQALVCSTYGHISLHTIQEGHPSAFHWEGNVSYWKLHSSECRRCW